MNSNYLNTILVLLALDPFIFFAFFLWQDQYHQGIVIINFTLYNAVLRENCNVKLLPADKHGIIDGS